MLISRSHDQVLQTYSKLSHQVSNADDVPPVASTADSCIMFSFHSVSRLLLSLVSRGNRRADFLPKSCILIALVVIDTSR